MATIWWSTAVASARSTKSHPPDCLLAPSFSLTNAVRGRQITPGWGYGETTWDTSLADGLRAALCTRHYGARAGRLRGTAGGRAGTGCRGAQPARGRAGAHGARAGAVRSRSLRRGGGG